MDFFVYLCKIKDIKITLKAVGRKMIKIRYFFGFFEVQQKWLNSMAQKGLRLIRVEYHKYEFIESKEKYNYNIAILLNKSKEEIKSYVDSLNEMGCKTFRNGINLNYSFLKVKWRLGQTRFGYFDGNRGIYNKEVLIIESKEQEMLPLHITKEDICSYYINVRNAYILPILLCLIALMDSTKTKLLLDLTRRGSVLVFSGIIVLLLLGLISCQYRIMQLRKEKGKILK